MWTKEQSAQFLKLMSPNCFLTGYVSSNIRIQNAINISRGLNTHEYHVIIEDILPIVFNISGLTKRSIMVIIRLYLISFSNISFLSMWNVGCRDMNKMGMKHKIDSGDANSLAYYAHLSKEWMTKNADYLSSPDMINR